MITRMSPSPDSTIDLGSISAEGVHLNIAPVVIATTEDKLRLALRERQNNFRSREAWIAPLGLFISIALALATTNFRKFGLEANVWEAIFWIGGLMSGVWLVRAWITRPKEQSEDEFIQLIKRSK